MSNRKEARQRGGMFLAWVGAALVLAAGLFLWAFFGLDLGVAFGTSTVGVGLLGACTGSMNRG